MAGTKITDFPTATVPLTGTEIFPVVQGGVTKQTTINQTTANSARILANIAALQALNTATSSLPVQVQLTSNYVAGDGGGVFRYDSTDTTTADNGGTVIVDATGRRWKRQFDGPVNVQWFGANGSGATDALALSANTTAFRACETYVSSLTDGGSIYIPRGRYFLGDQVVCNGAGKPITWFGDGDESVVSLINNSPMKFFYVDSTSLSPVVDSAPCIFRDFQIPAPQGSGALNNGAISIYTDNRKLTLIRMTISGRIGVQLGSNAFGSQLLDCSISNCTYEALLTANDKSANNLVVRGGEYFSNGQEGLASAFEILNGDAILFDGVQIEGNYNGIQCRDVQSLKITSCYIELSTNVNFYIAAGTSKSIALTESWFGVQGSTTTLENCEKVDIESCTFYGLNPGECTWTTGATGLNINFAGSNTLLGSATWVPGAGTFRVLTSYHSSTTPTAPTAGTTLHLAQADGTANRLTMDSCDAASVIGGRRRNGTYAIPTVVASGNALLNVGAGGWDGAAFIGSLAYSSVVANQNYSVGANGTRYEIYTTPDGSASASLRLTVAADGGVFTQGAAGGSQGTNTINSGGVYDDGVLICAPLNADNPEQHTQAFWDSMVPVSTNRRKHRTAKRHFDMIASGFDASNPDIYFGWLDRDKAIPGMITLEEWDHRNPVVDGQRVAIDKQSVHERTERQNLALDYMALTIKAMWEEIKRLRGSALAAATPAAPPTPADM